MTQEFRYALRSLFRARALACLVILTLALGIGANTAIFSVANALLLRPLPYVNADRLVLVWGNFLKLRIGHLAAKGAEYLDYRDQKEVFSETAAFQNRDFTRASERIAGARVSDTLFPMLGAQVVIGRSFLPEDCLIGQDRVAVLSHALWRSRFGANPAVLGGTVELDGEEYEIVGVMSPSFKFPHPAFSFTEPAELWTPLSLDPEQVAARGGGYELNVIGRLKDGIGLEQARSTMSGLASSMEQRHRGYRGPKGEDGGWRISLVTLQEEIAGSNRYSLLVLLGIAGLVLLIACANVANLLLVRATARRREMAMRIALGASRVRIVRQLLAESVILGLAGGTAGLIIALWCLELLIAISPRQLPRFDEISLDWRVLAFTVTISTLSGLICGLAPAWQASDQNLNQVMRGSTSVAGRPDRLRKLLVSSQIAVAVCVLVSAGLLVKSFVLLQRVDLGLNPRGVLTFEVGFSETRYAERALIAAFCEDALSRMRALPGVESVGLSSMLPLSGVAIEDPFSIEGRPLDMSRLTLAGHQSVSPGFFATLGIPLASGRDFSETDLAGSPDVAIINGEMSARFFAGEDPIGRRIKVGAPHGPAAWATIVGVVKAIPHGRLDSDPQPDWYRPQSQVPVRRLSLFIRSRRDPLSLAPEVRSAVADIDRSQPIINLRTMESAIGKTLAPRRFNTILAGLFAAVALLLAAGGIYSVVAYAMQRRTREIGIRIALGAQRRDVLKLALVEGMMPAVIGLAIGLAVALALSRFLKSLLFGVATSDPVTFTSIGLLLAAVALVGCYLPARRASRIDPLVALRYE